MHAEQVRIDAISNHFEVGAVSDAALLSETSRYLTQVREFIAPVDGLKDRAGELDVLESFCRGDRPYLWIRAEPWAGKSALLSWFALYPPPDVTVISFFVTDRLADQSDHTAFTVAVFDQLAVLLPDQRALIAAAVLNRDGLRNDLLATAARREAQRGRRLVLVLDGADEDTGRPAIVSLLPTRPDPNLRVVVASRYGPHLPIPAVHPLTDARPYRLTSSPFAAGVRARAIKELDDLLGGPEQHRQLLALITAANGLTRSELVELTDLAPYEIDTLLRGVAGRSFRTSTAPDEHSDPVYALAHETLQRTAEERLGARQLTTALNRLHHWAERYRDRDWPADTPDFLLRRYFPVLDRHNDLPRMIASALDAGRHDCTRARTGGDATALAEIRTTQQRICDQPDPDLLATARLARYRDRIHERSDSIPLELLTVLTMLAEHDRAEAIAHSYSTPDQQAAALTQLVRAVAATGPDRAARLRNRAEVIARTITNPNSQATALTRLAEAVAATDLNWAEAITRTIADPYRQATALARLVEAVAIADPDRAAQLAERAETFACNITDPYERGIALSAIAGRVATTDLDRAEAIVRTITDPYRQATALSGVAGAVVATDPVRAVQLASRAEAIACTIADPYRQATALAQLARVVAVTDPDRAETSARAITDRYLQTTALSGVAVVVAASDPDRAETIARAITESDQQGFVLSEVAVVVAASDPDRAETIARAITESDQLGIALSGVAV
ncbi:hypothetical protein, partial [Nocardia sp. NPDC057353]|uniref:hypothetical protein n=1 Tax=Nocardia sp. NPDC057353 TaxID=3346104 RepID=UPI003641162A